MECIASRSHSRNRPETGRQLHILSNVPAKRASAARLAQLYGKRWSIENTF